MRVDAGVKLIHLLEIITKDKCAVPCSRARVAVFAFDAVSRAAVTCRMPRRYVEEPKMEIHCKENLKTAFDFMRNKGLQLDIIGGDDIAGGNEKLTLGLVWTLIVSFQVEDIQLDGVSGKDGLMLWCQRQCPTIEVKDFSKTWRNGIAFCTIMHRFRPDAFNLEALDPRNGMENMELALSTAENHFGVDRLFDPEDVVMAEKPDEKIVLTYLSQVFCALAKFTKSSGLVKAVKKVLISDAVVGFSACKLLSDVMVCGPSLCML